MIAPPQARAVDRRLHQRMPVLLLGRYMLSDRQEYPCQTINISPGGVLMIAPCLGEIGERIVVYLEHLGRLEGEIKRHMPQGLAFCIAATPRKRDKLASQLTWLANRAALGLPEDRRHERIVPRLRAVTIKVESGREFSGHLIDVSLSGAAIQVETQIPLGTAICVGKTPAQVVRHFQGGIAVEFRLSISPDRFGEGIVL